MGDYIFINQAFTNAINEYLAMKQTPENPAFSSFSVVVIRTLITIYGELDIINPYRTKNEKRMGGFDENLTKFGLPKAKLQQLKEAFQNYEDAKNNQKSVNPYILMIEKILIDMFYYRKKLGTVSETEEHNFQSLLYQNSNSNQYMEKQFAQNPEYLYKIEQYYKSKMFELNHNFKLTPYKQNTLIPEAYTILGYTLESISQMDEKTLDQLNQQIFNFFKIDLNDNNKEERLKEAVSYYKQYGNSITTGNGYVDMLLLLSVIATIMMTLFVITVKVLGG